MIDFSFNLLIFLDMIIFPIQIVKNRGQILCIEWKTKDWQGCNILSFEIF